MAEILVPLIDTLHQWIAAEKIHCEASERLRALVPSAPGYPSVFAYQGWRECELKNHTQARVLAERALA